jgi:hypothetical protein
MAFARQGDTVRDDSHTAKRHCPGMGRGLWADEGDPILPFLGGAAYRLAQMGTNRRTVLTMARKHQIGTDKHGQPIWAAEPKAPPFLDLHKICRDAETITTKINIWTDYDSSPWIALGQVRLLARDRPQKGIWELAAYLDNATDFEHDSAFALKMDLVGVELCDVSYGYTTVQGWIHADQGDNFRVPPMDYDPCMHKNAVRCTECKGAEAHVIIPADFYVPPMNFALWEQVKGRRIEILTGPFVKKR